ncbi:aldo-keto reductase family 1 member D1 isoform X3 [Peromyscus californicus insignis]|uniref:aldo-keto reductase family 1 member D1 isoform X3 n=1 Tax=Peromyscus californicus insignis TaxID=564181 RepID=UPI0022A7D65D|nr:aldo-keto reductase family 1 member D1 isoform X3 [Peromyscus californicus insignis]
MIHSATNHRIPLSDGNSIPLIGLGTYSDPRPVRTCVLGLKMAIDEGYRHFDGAYIYNNEHEVGEAIREKIAEGKVKREEIFYCGKLWATEHTPELVRPALERTLKGLKLDYVDLFIIEIPMAFEPGKGMYPKDENGQWLYHKSDLCATWEVECHPYFTQAKLWEFCQQHDIVIVAYSPLGTCRNPRWVNVSSPSLLKDELLISLGKKYNKTAAQIALRFNIQRGMVVIPKSFNHKRIQENFQIFDFSLTEEEMKDIAALNKNVRFVELLMWSNHPEYPFHDEY